MATERRRQRQQRVRHEAGDYVPTCPKVANEEKIVEQPTNNIVEPTPQNQGYHGNIVEPTPQNQNHHDNREQRNISPSEQNNNFRRENTKYDNVRDQRQDHGRGRGRGGARGRGGGASGRGGGASARGGGASGRGGGARPEHPPTRTTNVAVVEEEREYEPVRIMESKTDVPKELGELPQPPKYRRREVISNWLRYEELPPQEDEEPPEGEDYLLGEDFSEALSNSGSRSAGGFLHLRGEVSWGAVDQGQHAPHGLGALKVADLVAALGTIPLHHQLKIPEESLPSWSVTSFKTDASLNLKNFLPDKEYVTDMEVNSKVLDSLKLWLCGPPSEGPETTPLKGQDPQLDAVHAALKLSPGGETLAAEEDIVALVREDSPLNEQGRVPEVNGVRESGTTQPQRQAQRKSPQPQSRQAQRESPQPQSKGKKPQPQQEPTQPQRQVKVEEPQPQQESPQPQHQAKKVSPQPQAQRESPQPEQEPPQPQVKRESPQPQPQREPPQVQPQPQREPSQPQRQTKSQPTGPPSTGLDFGLTKGPTPRPTATVVPSPRKDPPLGAKTPQENPKEPKPPPIDLDTPNPEPSPPVLVRETEVENLEDWLDSVLDD